MPVNRMARPVGAGRAPGATMLTPKEVLGILRRHILLIISSIIIGFIVGGVSWFLLLKFLPKYTAQTYIKVLPPVEKDPMTIGGVVVAKDILYGHRQSMADLIKQQSTLRELLDRDNVQETTWFQHFGKINAVRIIRAFRKLKKHFRVSALRDGDFILLSMTCGDKKEAALIVNEMVDLFLSSQGVTKRAEVAAKLAGLEAQRLRTQTELDAAEKALDAVRTATGLTGLEERNFRSVIEEKLSDLERQQNSIVLGIDQLRANVETLRKQAQGPINEQVQRQIETDATMTMLAQQLAMTKSNLGARLTKFGENHREVRQAQELVDKIEAERENRKTEIAELTRQANYRNAVDNLFVFQSQLEELEKMRAEAEAKKKDLDMARFQYEQRLSIRDGIKQRLEDTKDQIAKMRIMSEDPETPKVQFVGYAPEPIEISSPKWELYLPGGTVLGFMCGIGLAFLIELLNDLVRTPRDVARVLHIRLLGVVPDAAEDEQTRDIDPCLTVSQAPYSIISESYRQLRTNLKLSSPADSSKVLLVSSGTAGDGKTSVAVNLATTFVAENKKVLLIDANFRQPNLQKIFPRPAANQEPGEQSDFGLSNLLTAQCGPQEAIRPSSIEGISLIDAGRLPSNPTELLGTSQMQQLLQQQRENFDYVIVDGPPVLLVSDAKVLARFVDGTILVFNAGATRRGAALRTIRELKDVKATIVGCVLLAVKALKGGYFHEQFRSYREYQKPQLARAT